MNAKPARFADGSLNMCGGNGGQSVWMECSITTPAFQMGKSIMVHLDHEDMVEMHILLSHYLREASRARSMQDG